jgi:hypothetical protein
MAHADPVAFMSLLGKALPMTIADTGKDEETRMVVENRVVWPKDNDGVRDEQKTKPQT